MDEAVSKAFWQWTMPLKLLNYSLVDPTIYAPLSCPKRVDVLYGMVAAGIIAFLLGRKHSFFAPLMALMLVGLGLYMLEGQGFSHDLILTIFASTTTFACALSMASKKLVHWLGEKASRIKPDQQYRFIVLTLVVLATCLTWMSLEHDRTKLLTYYYSRSITGDYQAEDLLEQSTRLQAPVTIFCNNIEPVYPYFLFSGRRPGGYLLWARPLKLFEWLKNNSGLKGPMKDFYDYTYWNIHNEIDQHKTEAFILSDYGVLDTFGREQMFKQLDRDYRIDVKTGHFFSCGNHQPREFSGYNGPFLFFVNKKGAGQ